MLKNYLTIALRNLRRQKVYSFINIAGLALGLGTCLVIGLFVYQSLSYDRFHPNADRLYRVIQNSDDGTSAATTPPGLAGALQRHFPEVEHVTIVGQCGRRLFSVDNKQFFVDRVLQTDHQFFRVYPFHLLRGNPASVLDRAGTMVVTRSLAERLFGQGDPIGRTLSYQNVVEYEITGVVEDVPVTSHFRFDALLSYSDRERAEQAGPEIKWNFFGPYLYFTVHEGADPVKLEAKIRAFEAAADKPEWMLNQHLALQPVTRIHLHSNQVDEIAPQSDIRYLYLFGGIGVLILLIACLNYMILATARATKRAREVGIRKVIGARRGQLVRQHLGESILIGFAALPLGVGLAQLVLPFINQASGQEIALTSLFNTGALLTLAAAVLLVCIVSGSYPALFLSRYRPVQVLAGHGDGSTRGRSGLRKALVTIQFTGSISILIATLVVWLQLDYVQHRRLGFEKEYVVTLDAPDGLSERYDAFKRALLDHPSVVSVSSGPPPGLAHATSRRGLPDPKTGERWEIDHLAVDYDYVQTLGLKLVAGRDFSKDHRADIASAILLNESALRKLQLGAHAVGRPVTLMPESPESLYLIGVVEDFHNASLHESIRPLMITLQPGKSYTILVRLRPGNPTEGLSTLERTWKRFVPGRPFGYQFLDDRIEAQYNSELRLARIFSLFAILSILIACLGLFGLAAFAAESRTKEIGIRKTMGASVASLVALLSSDFLKLVLVAFVIAVPVAYYAMSRWLEGFAYRIELGPGVFLLAGALALVVALATVATQAMRAALSDPVKSLRYE